VAGGHSRVGGAAEGDLEAAPIDPRVCQGGAHRRHAHVGDGRAFEAAERVDAGAGDLDGGHAFT